jgi:hypothetical protein
VTLKLLLALLTPVLIASLKDVLHRILMALVGRKVVEWAVLSALEWLAKRTDSHVDDELVDIVKKALQPPPDSVESAKSVPPDEQGPDKQ